LKISRKKQDIYLRGSSEMKYVQDNLKIVANITASIEENKTGNFHVLSSCFQIYIHCEKCRLCYMSNLQSGTVGTRAENFPSLRWSVYYDTKCPKQAIVT
jgi:hypothetical protein